MEREHKQLSIVEILRARAARIKQLEMALTDCWGTLLIVQALQEEKVLEEHWEDVSSLVADVLRTGADVMGFTPEVMRQALEDFSKERKETEE